MKDENTSTHHSKKHSHRRRLIKYFTVPAVYFLVSLIIVVPVCLIALNFAIGTVHTVQQTLAMDFNDVSPDSTFNPSDKTDGTIVIDGITPAKKMGEITCDNAGLKADVYYGINRVSLRNGAAVKGNGGLPGEGEVVTVKGFSNSFSALKNVKVGDIVTFSTSYGTYKYKAKKIARSSEIPSDGNILVLVTASENKAFSIQNDERLYVLCSYVSGPVAEEAGK